MPKRKPDLGEFEALTEVEELRKQITRLEREKRQAETRTIALVEAVREGAKDAAVVLGNPPKVPPAKKDKRKGKPEVALLHLSDWQIGKVTESYDTKVANRRIDKLADKVIELAEIERADHPVRECHVLWGGDLPENVDIFPGQAHEVDGSLFAQMMAAKGAGVRLLRKLLAGFEKVTCWEEYGNHGRLGRKGDHPREDSADLLIYGMIRDKLAEHEKEGRLVWNEAQGWHSIVEVGNYRALLVHGDEIRQFGGNIPAFGIAKKVNAWASGVVEPFTDCYMGHFHQPLVIPLANGEGRTFVNPSLESDNVYAQEFMGATGTPGQRLNFVDPRRGRVTTERIIWLA